jgi:hypothetical protein
MGKGELKSDHANTLRRAELTLSRWGEMECGTDQGCIERDETTGKPYWLSARTGRRTPISDRETGALKRVAALCKDIDLHYFHQTDPRGAGLYVGVVPLNGENYNRAGVSCYVG